MDSFNDYFYLTILVIAVFSALVRSIKKAVKTTQTKTSPKPKWEDLMRQLQETEQQEPLRAEAKIEMQTKAHAQPITPRVKIKEQKPSTQTAEALDDVSEVNDWELNSAEAAKRAFVYSEIFNRKYEM